jgi:type IV secretory pathway TraG/TraD family ATPase VirD4
VAINFRQNWLGLAWQWAVAVVIWFIAVKILGAIGSAIISDDLIARATAAPTGMLKGIPFMQAVGNLEANILSFLRSGEFIGILPSFFLAKYLLKGHKLELEHACVFSIGGVVLFDIMALLTGGPSRIDWMGSLFLLECAPVWTWVADLFLGWHGSSQTQHEAGIKYTSPGKYQRGVQQAAHGSVQTTFELLTKKETPQGTKAGISIWEGEPFPFKRENQHFLITGSPGAGKTQIIFPMVYQAFKRGDKAIVWDIKGTFIQAFAGKEGVDLLAGWDKRSIAWSPGMDIRSQLDCQQVASIMFPPNPKDSQPFFLNSARQILEAIFVYLDSQGQDWGWGDVWSILSMEKNEIAKVLSSFEDGKALANVIGGDSKATEDIYSTLIGHAQQTIRWYAKAWPKGTVSLRKWVHGNSKLLIIGGIPERTDLAQATANISVELIVNEILSLPDDPNRRIWLFLDELATLGKLTSLLNAFSLGRSKGLCVVAGIQDIGKLEHHYGAQLAKSIANTFSTQIVLRCSDHDTAQWASKNLGEQEVIITQKSTSSGSSDGKSSSSSSESEVLKTMSLFMPSQISNFENLEGVIRASGWPLLHVGWSYQNIPQTQALVEEADWLKKKEKPVDKKPEPPAEPNTTSSFRLEE